MEPGEMDEIIRVAQPCVGEEEVQAVREIILSGRYVSGERVRQFEEEFAGYIGTRYAVAVNSGTSALHIALEAAGVREGDEVIVPPMTFFATVSSVLYLRAVPVFADIDPDDYCLSPSDVEKRITPKTKAIVPVHLFGNSAKMDAFMALSEATGVPVIEDCAQAHGTQFQGRKVGSFGKAGCFSFFATKHMTTGEGGMITTNDEELAESARIIRNHGMIGRDRHVLLGYNNRMNEIQAAMGLVQLKKLDYLNEKRISNSKYLVENLAKLDWLILPKEIKGVKHTFFWFPVMIDYQRCDKSVEDLKSHLRKNGIEFRHRYKEPLYRQEVLANLGLSYQHLHLPEVEKVAGKIIGLPNHPQLKKDHLDRVVDVLRSFCDGGRFQ